MTAGPVGECLIDAAAKMVFFTKVPILGAWYLFIVCTESTGWNCSGGYRQQCNMLWSASFRCFRWTLESKEHAPDRLAVGRQGGNIKLIMFCTLRKDCVLGRQYFFLFAVPYLPTLTPRPLNILALLEIFVFAPFSLCSNERWKQNMANIFFPTYLPTNKHRVGVQQTNIFLKDGPLCYIIHIYYFFFLLAS